MHEDGPWETPISSFRTGCPVPGTCGLKAASVQLSCAFFVFALIHLAMKAPGAKAIHLCFPCFWRGVSNAFRIDSARLVLICLIR